MNARRLVLAALGLLLVSSIAEAQDFKLQVDPDGIPMQGVLRYGSARKITVNSGSNTVTALNSGVKAIDIVCTVACHVLIGQSPARATTNDSYIPANWIVRLKIGPSDSLAVIADGTPGTAYLTELN